MRELSQEMAPPKSTDSKEASLINQARSTFARRMNRVVWRAENLLWEYRLNIRTRGLFGEDGAERRHYGTIPYSAIFELLNRLSLGPTDVFVDLGSGKGRAVCCAATYGINLAIGVEYLANLHELAQHNARCLRGKRASIDFLRGEAQGFDFTVGTIFYLFNPFGPKTLEQVIERLEDGIQKKPRPVRIVYVNPLHESILAQSGWLLRDAVYQPRGFSFPVSIWKSI